MYEFLWFVGGALLYKLLSKLLKIYQVFILFQEVQIQTISMLIAAAKDLEQAADFKQETLGKTELSKESLEAIKKVDLAAINLWKELSVKKLIVHTPSYFKAVIQFQTWNECVNYYNSAVRDEYKTKNGKEI